MSFPRLFWVPRHKAMKEKLRLFWSVYFDTVSYEDALWAVLEADRQERNDERRRARDGGPLDQHDPVVAAVLTTAARRAGITVAQLTKGSRRFFAARGTAIRALRDQGYSYRAIGRAIGRTHSGVQKALYSVAARRELVEAAESLSRASRRHVAAHRRAA